MTIARRARLLLPIGIAAASLLAAMPAFADTTPRTPEQNKALYELQEKCAKDAADFLDKVKAGKVVGARLVEQPDELQHESIVELQNHYSAKLNKCFVEMQNIANDDREYVTVWDVNERRQVATFLVYPKSHVAVWCGAENPDHPDEDLDCGHYTEIVGNPAMWPKWKAVIKPYMQDSD
jgi:hypothetical protein